MEASVRTGTGDNDQKPSRVITHIPLQNIKYNA